MEAPHAGRHIRKRVKGKWSGPEAKHSFLREHLVDDGLAARLEELRGVSHWWPWLSCLQDEHETEITYFCPTYVLYDALTSEGRGEWEERRWQGAPCSAG